MTVSEHRFERLDARQVRQEGNRGLDVQIGVVVVGIDVVGGVKADDVRAAVRQDLPQGLVRTVLVLVAAILHADRHAQLARGQRDRSTAGRSLGDPLPDIGVDAGVDGNVVRTCGQHRAQAKRIESPADGDAAVRRERQFLDPRSADVAGLVLPLAARAVLCIDVEVPVAGQAAARPGDQLVHVVVVLMHARSALGQSLAKVEWFVRFRRESSSRLRSAGMNGLVGGITTPCSGTGATWVLTV